MIRKVDPFEMNIYQAHFYTHHYVCVPELFSATVCQGYTPWIISMARRRGQVIDKPAGGPGAIGDEPLQYTVLTGSQIQSHLSNLFEWVTSLDFAAFLQPLIGDVFMPGHPHCELDSYVNVNYLQGVGAKYQFHRDDFPYTGLLFLHDLPEGAGGELEMHVGPEQRPVLLRPQAGMFLLFDGSKIPHRVLPLTGRGIGERVSVPLSLYTQVHERSADIQNYLYAPMTTVGFDEESATEFDEGFSA
jgi:hypothetical protein